MKRRVQFEIPKGNLIRNLKRRFNQKFKKERRLEMKI